MSTPDEHGIEPRDPRPLTKPWNRVVVIQQLADGKLSNTEIAEKWGITPQAISQFGKRYAAEIEAQRADLENEFAALWVADKHKRIAVLQQDIEQADFLQSIIPTGDSGAVARVKHAALKQVAEELGQIPNKTQVQHTGKVEYNIVGVDTSDLQ